MLTIINYNHIIKIPIGVYGAFMENETTSSQKNAKNCNCKLKNTPRSEKTVQNLKNRLSRVIGQLGRIKKMIDDGRYCDDILMQLSACKKALDSVSKAILKEHFETCIVEEIRNGNTKIVDELFDTLNNIK